MVLIDKDFVLNSSMKTNYNELSIELYRSFIMELEAKLEKENNKEIQEQLDLLYKNTQEEMTRPRALSFDRAKALELSNELEVEISNSKMVQEIVDYSDEKEIIFDVSVYKDVQELKSEYRELVKDLEANNPEVYEKRKFDLAVLYDGAIKDYYNRSSKKIDNIDAVEVLAQKITTLEKLKENAHKRQVNEIDFLIRKVVDVMACYSYDLADKYQFRFFEENDIDNLILLLNEPTNRAERDLNEVLHKLANTEEKQEELEEEQEKEEEKPKYGLWSDFVIKDYSQEKIDMTNMTIADKIYHVGLATEIKVSHQDPVLVQAYQECYDKTLKELGAYPINKVEQMKNIYGNNWQEAYMEEYTKAWNFVINREIDEIYDNGIKARAIEVKEVEKEFSLDGVLNKEILNTWDNNINSHEATSDYELKQQANVSKLNEASQEKNLAEFKQAKSNLQNELVSDIKSQPQDLATYLDNASPIQSSAYSLALLTEDRFSKEEKLEIIKEELLKSNEVEKEESRSK